MKNCLPHGINISVWETGCTFYESWKERIRKRGHIYGPNNNNVPWLLNFILKLLILPLSTFEVTTASFTERVKRAVRKLMNFSYSVKSSFPKFVKVVSIAYLGCSSKSRSTAFFKMLNLNFCKSENMLMY